MSGDTSKASRRAMTTTSIFPIFCCILKFSRTVRLITFLSTAFFIFFLAMAKPSLSWPKSFLTANTVKYRSLDFWGWAKTRWNSPGLVNRCSRGKPNCSPPNYTVNLARPFARRAFNTLRPPTVAILARKPWVLTRFILLG